MKNKNILMRLLSLAVVLAMVAVMTFSLASCGNNETKDPLDSGTESVVDTNDTEEPADSEDAQITIKVTVVHANGESAVFDIPTTEGATLRAALESIDLVQGDESEFGLYVKVVDGETADYDVDGAYWAFYQGGEYMMTGVDSTLVVDGDQFEIVYTK